VKPKKAQKTPSLSKISEEPQPYKSNKQNRNQKNMEDRRRASEKYRERQKAKQDAKAGREKT